MTKNTDPDQKIIDKIVNLYNQGDLKNVLKQSEKLTVTYPKAFVFWNFMGASSARLGELNKAIFAFQRVVALTPHNIKAHFNLGNVYQDNGDFEKAIKAYSRLLALKPDYVEVLNNMGNVLKKQGKFNRALEVYNKALQLKPDFAEVHFNVGNLFEEQNSFKEAIMAYKAALLHKPDYFQSYYNLGNLLHKIGDLEEALKAYNHAISIKSDFAEAYNNLGNLLKDLDRIEEAINAYRHAIAIKPDFAVAHRNLSNIKIYNADDEQILSIQTLIDDPGTADGERCNLLYAFAKIKEDLGEFETALNSYKAAGVLRKKELNYDFLVDEQIFEKLYKSAPNLVKNTLKNPDFSFQCCPIFILGMPRSGSTLVEQIVSSHSQVNAAGELPFLSYFGDALASGKSFPSMKRLQAVRYSYLNKLKKASEGKPFVTDKMPQNFKYIGLICAAIPEAKIIHVERDAAATCWSNFKHYFPAKGLGYSYDLLDTIRYFELYKNFMSIWGELVANKIYHFNYDKLTVDQENQTKQLIKYLGLDWEDACLFPEKNKRKVGTASELQIRRKVYKGSSQSWQKFKPYLEGIFDRFFI